jgi:hypothetical protein
MDDGDRDADAYSLLEGDEVKVSGMIDDDLLERHKIEASSVYVEKLDTYFYASAQDEEDQIVSIVTTLDKPASVVQGTVTSVNPAQGEFTLGSGANQFNVEVDTMPYDPLDNEGYQQITKGDRVSVTAYMYYDLFDGRTLAADSIVTLSNNEDQS